MADAYSYPALPSDTHIRYLLLEPGESGDQIVCSLHVTKLEDQKPYEAISYAWGTPERTEPIQCDGKTLYVTVNLRDSLVAVRRLNDAQKAQQVSLMAEIYRKSTRTLICIGLDDYGGHAEAVSGIVTEANHMMDKVFQDEDFSWEPNSFPPLSARDPLASDPRWKSVFTLADQPWFKRCWVVQEAALGSVAEIIWGGVRIDWLHLLRAFYWMNAKADVLQPRFRFRELSWLHLMSFERRLPDECMALQVVNYLQPRSLLHVLESCRSLGATDPRDRIYACLSLPHSTTFHGPQIAALKPDYNQTYLEVYHDFACAYLEATGMCLNLLGFTDNNDRTGLSTEGPSWVPRWDRSNHISVYRISPRRHTSQYPDRMPIMPRLVDWNTLKVRGVRLGFVQYTTQRFSPGTTLETIGRIWREVEAFGTSSHGGHNPYHASAKKAFLSTLEAGNYRGDSHEWRSREAAYMDYVERRASQQAGGTEGGTISPGTSEEDEDATAYAVEVHRVAMYTAQNRKLIVSDRGYYGLAPFAVEEGDAIYVIFGTTSPFILRQNKVESPSGGGKYRLVGDMYMYSAVGAGTGEELVRFGRWEGYDDWHDWGLQEQDILIC